MPHRPPSSTLFPYTTLFRSGCAVVNNPFWWSADEKFFNNALATKIGVAVPRTVLLPSNQPPTDTNDKSFRNLSYPDRKSTRLNSSHRCISYAVFCLKKKKKK